MQLQRMVSSLPVVAGLASIATKFSVISGELGRQFKPGVTLTPLALAILIVAIDGLSAL
jgi:hypothetical protein